jgi:hypothetical protein
MFMANVIAKITVDQNSLPDNQRFNATFIEEAFRRYGFFLLRMRR